MHGHCSTRESYCKILVWVLNRKCVRNGNNMYTGNFDQLNNLHTFGNNCVLSLCSHLEPERIRNFSINGWWILPNNKTLILERPGVPGAVLQAAS